MRERIGLLLRLEDARTLLTVGRPALRAAAPRADETLPRIEVTFDHLGVDELDRARSGVTLLLALDISLFGLFFRDTVVFGRTDWIMSFILLTAFFCLGIL